MRSADFFIKLGLFVKPGFLEPATCARIHEDAQVTSGVPGWIRPEGKEAVLDETKRRSRVVPLSDELHDSVEVRLHAVMPQLENHFALSLSGHEPSKVLIYREGDFFIPHRDASIYGEDSAHLPQRQISAVLFISDPQAYRGGALVLYGLVDHGPWRSRGFQVDNTPGLFVAFPPTLLHEVQPVLEGARVTLATFFF